MKFPLRGLCTALALLLLASFAKAAHSRRRYVTRVVQEPKYDRAITTFSPDGRLEQVEYGIEASMRGSPIAAVRTDSGIVIVLAQASQVGRVHRIDDHLWLITAGLSGDARFVADALRRYCQQVRSAYGGEPATAEQIARLAGSMQHQLTRTGGARPLGCTAIVAGVDPGNLDAAAAAVNSPSGGGTPRMFRTDPGGVVEEVSLCAAGRGSKEMLRALETSFDDDDADGGGRGSSSSSIEDRARSLARVVCMELDRNHRTSDGKILFDVWLIEPHRKRRGGMRATCFRQISPGSIESIVRGA